MNRIALSPVLLVMAFGLPACSQSSPPSKDVFEAPKMSQTLDSSLTLFPVTPLARAPAGEPPAQTQLSIGRGQFFAYALPPGWRVGEDGQFALTLVAPDNLAFTAMVGNAGLMPNYPPGQYVHDVFMALQPQGLQLGAPQPAQPATGFQYAQAFEVRYSVKGVASRGLAVCHVSPYYGGAVMAVTAAVSEASQWPGYADWLPLVAAQIAATNGAAFGIRGLMQQNLRESVAFGQAQQRYRDHSERLWQQTTAERQASQDRRQVQFRENLGAIQTYDNPLQTNQPLELTTRYSHYWIDRQGAIVGTNDPSVDPNVGSTGDWTRLRQRKP